MPPLVSYFMYLSMCFVGVVFKTDALPSATHLMTTGQAEIVKLRNERWKWRSFAQGRMMNPLSEGDSGRNSAIYVIDQGLVSTGTLKSQSI